MGTPWFKVNSGNAASSRMVLVRGGVYTMGTDLPIFVADGEAPARRVDVSSFYMDVHEVSNADFKAFVDDTGHETEAETFGEVLYCVEGYNPSLAREIKENMPPLGPPH